MKSSLPDRAIYRSEHMLVGAEIYNRVRLALERFGGPRWELLGQDGVEFRIDNHLWLCRDLNLNEPLLAWTDFERVRPSLHSAIRCRRILYSAYAGILANRLLTNLERRMEVRLVQERELYLAPARVLQFPRRVAE